MKRARHWIIVVPRPLQTVYPHPTTNALRHLNPTITLQVQNYLAADSRHVAKLSASLPLTSDNFKTYKDLHYTRILSLAHL